MKRTLLGLAVLAGATPTIAETSLQLGAAKVSNTKFLDESKFLVVRHEFNETIAVELEIFRSHGDWRDPGDHEELNFNNEALSLEYRIAVSNTVNLFARGGIKNGESKLNCISGCTNASYQDGPNKNGSGWIAGIGALVNPSDAISIRLEVLENDSGIADMVNGWTAYRAQSELRLNENFSLGVALEKVDGADEAYGLFGRYTFID